MTTWHQLRRFGLALAVVLAASLWGAEAAKADFTVCNYSRAAADVAVGYYDYDYEDWVSIGWYPIKGGQCDTLFILHEYWKDEYIYVYAESAITDFVWEGEYYFCVEDDAFEIFGYENCKARGFYTYGFVELDVRNYDTFTYELLE